MRLSWMRSLYWSVSLLVLSLTSGCQSSPPKQYFVLTAPSLQIEPGSTSVEYDIGIGPIEIPEYLNFTQMVYPLEDGSLQRMANSYWAEPLDQGIGRVVSINLNQSDHSRKLVLFPWGAENSPQYSVKIKLMSLSRDSNNVRLNVYWDLIDNQVNRHITQQHFTAVTKAGATAPDMVSAYSHLLTQLSEQIDKSLQQLPD